MLSSCESDGTRDTNGGGGTGGDQGSIGREENKREKRGKEWTARSGHQVVAVNNDLYLIGGTDKDGPKNDVWKSTDTGDSWTQVSRGGAASNSQWSARSGHQVVAVNNDLYLIGGTDKDGLKNDVWKSTDGGVTWQLPPWEAGPDGSPPAIAWSARSGHQVVVDKDGTFYLFGGAEVAAAPSNRPVVGGESRLTGQPVPRVGLDATPTLKNDVWKSDDDGESWTQATSNAGWSARSGHQVVAVNNELYLIGGTDKDGPKNDVWRSSDGASWVEVTRGGAASNSQWSARSGHQVVVKDGKFYLMGGLSNNGYYLSSPWPPISEADRKDEAKLREHYENNRGRPFNGDTPEAFYKNDVWKSDSGYPWSGVDYPDPEPTPWSGRFGHQVVVIGKTLLIIGGMSNDDEQPLKNDVWRSDDNGSSWY